MKQFASSKIGFGGFWRYQPIEGGVPVSPYQKYFLYFRLYFPNYSVLQLSFLPPLCLLTLLFSISFLFEAFTTRLIEIYMSIVLYISHFTLSLPLSPP